jgi:hypothetical protein
VLVLLGPDGKAAAFAGDEYFNPDRVLRFALRMSGEYYVEVRVNLYRGRADFVYRILAREGKSVRTGGERAVFRLPLLKAAAAE